ncbi:MAG: serine--tRNA ligase [Calditrichia bacterium]
MLDLKFIRENSDLVKNKLNLKKAVIDIDHLLEMDEKRRSLIQELQEWKQRRNELSQQVASKKKAGEDVSGIINETKELSQKIKSEDKNLADIEQEIKEILHRIPNLPHDSVPPGTSEDDNVEVERWGELPSFDFPIQDHMEIATRLGLIDFKRGGKISGSGYPVYTSLGARLERAIINFMLDLHTREHGYEEIFPPFLVNADSMFGTGQLPKMADDMYHLQEDDMYLIPTAEVPVTNLHRDEILTADQLPMKYAAYSACFRREAGSWGKETRGLLRLHQFNKVELVKFTRPETSYEEHETLLKDARKVLELLGLPYRVLSLCSADLSFAAAKCYDLEVWAPAEKMWLEVSSCSNFEDFQARRANIRFRPEQNAKPEFVHTLNASGVATPRLMVAILEHYQTDEGSVIVPEPLRDYFGASVIKRKL